MLDPHPNEFFASQLWRYLRAPLTSSFPHVKWRGRSDAKNFNKKLIEAIKSIFTVYEAEKP